MPGNRAPRAVQHAGDHRRNAARAAASREYATRHSAGAVHGGQGQGGCEAADATQGAAHVGAPAHELHLQHLVVSMNPGYGVGMAAHAHHLNLLLQVGAHVAVVIGIESQAAHWREMLQGLLVKRHPHHIGHDAAKILRRVGVVVGITAHGRTLGCRASTLLAGTVRKRRFLGKRRVGAAVWVAVGISTPRRVNSSVVEGVGLVCGGGVGLLFLGCVARFTRDNV